MAQQPDDIIVIQKIQKILSSSYQNIGDTNPDWLMGISNKYG